MFQRYNYIFFLRVSFLVSLFAVFGSLYFSEVLGFPPCMLCWYQRICIYPLVFIFGIGLLKEDRNCLTYAWPLIISGILLASYHNLLYFDVIPEAAAPCQEGASCTSKHVEYLGFITIPLLSLGGFVFLAALNFVMGRSNEEK